MLSQWEAEDKQDSRPEGSVWWWNWGKTGMSLGNSKLILNVWTNNYNNIALNYEELKLSEKYLIMQERLNKLKVLQGFLREKQNNKKIQLT